MYFGGRGQNAEALKYYQKTLALDPDFGPAINTLAYLYATMGDYPEALRHLERYAALNPDDPNPKDSIAELYLRMGRLDEAVARYRSLLAAKPDFFISWIALSYVYALQENYADAKRCLKQFLVNAPPSARADGEWLAAFYRYLGGEWDGALADYLSIRRRVEADRLAYYIAVVDWITGFIYCDQGQFDRAREAFRSFDSIRATAQAKQPNNDAAGRYFFRAWTEFKEGRADSARAALRKMEPFLPGIESGRERVISLFGLLTAEIALSEGSIDSAIAVGQRIVPPKYSSTFVENLAPNNVPFLKDVLARAYWKKGDLDKAEAEYRKLITIDPDSPARLLIHPLYHYRLGRVLEEKGKREEARGQYRIFLMYWKDADPDHPELADARKRLGSG